MLYTCNLNQSNISEIIKYQYQIYVFHYQNPCFYAYVINNGAPLSFAAEVRQNTSSRIYVLISSYLLAPVAEQAGSSLAWSDIPKDRFSHNEVHTYCENL